MQSPRFRAKADAKVQTFQKTEKQITLFFQNGDNFFLIVYKIGTLYIIIYEAPPP